MFGETKPVNWRENYAENLELGKEYQDFVSDVLSQHGLLVNAYSSRKYQLKGEGTGGIEIKFDRRFSETGNLYIELSEKRNPSNLHYFPSGVQRDDNTWLYAIGDYNIIFIFSKKQLKGLRVKFKNIEIATSRGYLMPYAEATRWALKIINVGQDE